MSAVIRALSQDGHQHKHDREVNVSTIFQEKPPPKGFFEGGMVPFLTKHKKSLLKILVIFLYYVIGCLYYNANMEWDALDCIYFITVSITTVGYGDYSPDNDEGNLSLLNK
jgi:hypothetical protein